MRPFRMWPSAAATIVALLAASAAADASTRDAAVAALDKLGAAGGEAAAAKFSMTLEALRDLLANSDEVHFDPVSVTLNHGCWFALDDGGANGTVNVSGGAVTLTVPPPGSADLSPGMPNPAPSEAFKLHRRGDHAAARQGEGPASGPVLCVGSHQGRP